TRPPDLEVDFGRLGTPEIHQTNTSSQRKTAGISPAVSQNISSIAGSGSDRSGNPLLQLLLWRRANLARGHLAALEDHQGRDRPHTVFRCGLRALVDIG